MDEKLLNRLPLLGAAFVCLAYFLPWASILTPLGSMEVRGLYVDYAWLILVLAVFHLVVQFARLNKAALGLPEGSTQSLDWAWKLIPFAFIAFFTWYGAVFIFRDTAPDMGSGLFGMAVEPTVRAGLDYGFWLGAVGAVLTLLSIGLLVQDIRKFASYAAILAALVVAAAFGLSKTYYSTNAPTPAQSVVGSGALPVASPPVKPAEPVLDAAPYVAVTKITGNVLFKDIEASRFNDSIVVSPVFKNVGSKTITGLQGRISLLDGFGKEVYGFNFRADDKLAPGEESTGGYSFEGNPFEDDDPYHKMLPLLNGGTAKFTSKVTRIAFEDGTVLPK